MCAFFLSGVGGGEEKRSCEQEVSVDDWWRSVSIQIAQIVFRRISISFIRFSTQLSGEYDCVFHHFYDFTIKFVLSFPFVLFFLLFLFIYFFFMEVKRSFSSKKKCFLFLNLR